MRKGMIFERLVIFFCCSYKVLCFTQKSDDITKKSSIFCGVKMYKEENLHGDFVQVLSSGKVKFNFEVQSLQSIGDCCWDLYDR